MGNSLSNFNVLAKNSGTKDDGTFEKALRDVALRIFPTKALTQQRHYLLLAIRKPWEMQIKDFQEIINELNN